MKQLIEKEANVGVVDTSGYTSPAVTVEKGYYKIATSTSVQSSSGPDIVGSITANPEGAAENVILVEFPEPAMTNYPSSRQGYEKVRVSHARQYTPTSQNCEYLIDEDARVDAVDRHIGCVLGY